MVRVLKALLLLAPLGALGWLLLASSWLDVERVEVRGVERLSEAQVLRAVDVRPGTPLARVDTSDVERAVGRLAPVADVEVQRSWPGTLRVTVTERVAVAGVLTRTSATLVDAAGVPFATERRLPEGVVRIEVPQVQRPDDTLRAVLQVHRALPEELSRRVFLVRAEDPANVVLLLRSGLQVVWGAPGDDATKAAAALALGDLPGTVIDVSAPGVVVRR